jgi:hypothetical protein
VWFAGPLQYQHCIRAKGWNMLDQQDAIQLQQILCKDQPTPSIEAFNNHPTFNAKSSRTSKMPTVIELDSSFGFTHR